MKVLPGVLFIYVLSAVTCENILGLFPISAKSHHVIFSSLMKEFARRGHNVTVVSLFDDMWQFANYTNICVKHLKHSLFHDVPINVLANQPLLSGLIGLVQIIYLENDFNSKILADSEIKGIIFNSSYDLVFIELFSESVFPLIAKKLDVPVIALSSGYSPSWILSPFAVPHELSFVPCFGRGFRKQMNIVDKILNVILTTWDVLTHKYLHNQYSKEVLDNQLGPSDVSVEDAIKNISLLFTNTHFSFYGGRPLPPQVVEVGGLHLEPIRSLPQELDKWMNESAAGVIYFSFGSMLRGSTLPADKVEVFLQVFRTLPQRVLWKWEDDTMDKLPKNVKIMKWLPQRDVLAHPAVKVFISHGGLLGTTEAVVSGVPILGIPMFGDQPNNVAALVENGVAIHVDYNNISVASLSYALHTLIYDKSYAENARDLSRRFLDRPMSPLDTAVYWTEYVIRHRGAPHLQSAAVHLPWYQYYLLDVIALLLAVLLFLLAFFYYTIKYCLRLVFQKKSTKLKIN